MQLLFYEVCQYTLSNLFASLLVNRGDVFSIFVFYSLFNLLFCVFCFLTAHLTICLYLDGETAVVTIKSENFNTTEFVLHMKMLKLDDELLD